MTGRRGVPSGVMVSPLGIGAMDLTDFRVFVAVAGRASFTRAARDLGLTQPAVSQRMKGIEKELGVVLTRTVGRSVHLTDAGEVLLEEARKVVRAVEAARDAVDEVRGLLRGHVSLGASTTPGLYFLPEILGRFKAEHPGLRVTMVIENSRTIEERLLSGDLDLAVVGEVPGHPGLRSEPLFRDRLRVFATAVHPLAARPEVRLADAVAEPFVMREPGSATRGAFERFIAARGLSVTIALELGNPEAVKRAVFAGAGLGVLSEVALVSEVECGRLAILPVRDLDLPRGFRLTFRRDRDRSRAVRALVACLRAAGEEARR